MDKGLVGIRVTAVSVAMELADRKPATADRFNVQAVLKDAEEIEKYILGYETKESEQE